jgi:triacylglycerol lipase
MRKIAAAAAVVVAGLLTGPLMWGASAASSSGYNDWSCRPTAAHPDPVVLVHGLGATGPANWGYIGPLLAANGYCAFALTYGINPAALLSQSGGQLPMEQSAQQLAAYVDQVRQATGAAKVDIVGHSEGSLMPDYYVKFLGGAAVVNRYVGITPLWQGTNLLGLGSLAAAGQASGLTGALVSLVTQGGCQSCPEFLPGSAFLTKLNSGGGPAVAGVTYTMLMTRYDELVSPYTSGVLQAPNATNIVMQDQCPFDLSGHAGMAVDPNVGQDVLNALDPAHAHAVACSPALVTV